MSKEIITIRNLSFQYHHQINTLNDINVTIKEGRITGICGPNGSGKSSLIRCCLMILKQYQGDIIYQDENLKNIADKKLRKELAYMPAELPHGFSFLVRDIVAMGRFPNQGVLGKLCKTDNDIIDSIIQDLGLEKLKNKTMDEISSGEQQLTFFARTLAQSPSVLFLDEPFTHIDPKIQMLMLDCLKRLQKENGLTTIVVSHQLNTLLPICDDLIFLKQGKIKAAGPKTDVLKSSVLSELFDSPLNIIPVGANPYPLVYLDKRF